MIEMKKFLQNLKEYVDQNKQKILTFYFPISILYIKKCMMTHDLDDLEIGPGPYQKTTRGQGIPGPCFQIKRFAQHTGRINSNGFSKFQ